MDMLVLSLVEVERKAQPDNAVQGKTKTGNHQKTSQLSQALGIIRCSAK
jgi:hypothetical protein